MLSVEFIQPARQKVFVTVLPHPTVTMYSTSHFELFLASASTLVFRSFYSYIQVCFEISRWYHTHKAAWRHSPDYNYQVMHQPVQGCWEHNPRWMCSGQSGLFSLEQWGDLTNISPTTRLVCLPFFKAVYNRAIGAVLTSIVPSSTAVATTGPTTMQWLPSHHRRGNRHRPR